MKCHALQAAAGDHGVGLADAAVVAVLGGERHDVFGIPMTFSPPPPPSSSRPRRPPSSALL